MRRSGRQRAFSRGRARGVPSDLVRAVREALAGGLGLAPAALDPRRPLADYGLSSMDAVHLAGVLSSLVGERVPPTIFWDCPTLASLCDRLEGVGQDQARTRAERRAAEAEPVAIVGMACRFPGAPDPAAFWRLLTEGRDAVGEAPAGRSGPDAGPAVVSRARGVPGGYLERVDLFDAAFFEISPREADSMDPQQRLVLELAWEALEDARISAARLRGQPGAVFVGAMWSEYDRLAHRDPEAIAQHTTSGSDAGIIASRVSFRLGLTGPSMVVNTGCSSSLVAAHLACASLERGECSFALVGGVNLLLTGETTDAVTKLGPLSPTGRCHAFDAQGDGYVRGEGGGMVLLKPLSRALRDGHRVYATILGTAVNNNGPGAALTAPSPAAQERVMRAACLQAGVRPGDLDYLEAHGTGTFLGDPIEAQAIGAVHGAQRGDRPPLLLGTVKTNIGHLEAAAGVAGLIKTALCLHHGHIPPSLHFSTPNPLVDFKRLGLRVVTEGTPWPPPADVHPTAGVSSFGYGGTNCHLVMRRRARSHPPIPVPVSGQADAPVFVFPGLGTLHSRAGRRLFETEPVFARELERCARIIELCAGWNLIDELMAPEGEQRIHDPAELDFVAPAQTALQLALTALWESRGVTPAAVVGSSWGEVAAARAAGLLSRVDAMTLILAIGEAYHSSQEHGGSLWVVGLNGEEAARVLGDGPWEVVGENAPDRIVLCGEDATLAPRLLRLSTESVKVTKLADVWTHCRRAEPYCTRLASWRGTGPASPGQGIPMISTVQAAPVGVEVLDGSYWVENLVRPIRSREAKESLQRSGLTRFLELAPEPVLQGAADHTVCSLGGGVEPSPAPQRAGRGPAGPFLLSASDEPALAAQVQRLATLLRQVPPPDLHDLAYSLATTRAHHAHRLALPASDRSGLKQALATASESGSDDERIAPRHVDDGAKIAMLFTGQGAQYPGMAEALYRTQPVFRAGIERCTEATRGQLRWPLADILLAREGDERAAVLRRTDHAQPVVFALGWALTELWASFRVFPDVVFGHSLGECVAACVSGVMSVEDGLRLVLARGRVMQACTGGRMVSLRAPLAAVQDTVRAWTDEAVVAAVNGPERVVVSGSGRALSAICRQLEAQGYRSDDLPGDVAFHSPALDPALAEFEDLVETLALEPPGVPLVSGLTGEVVAEEVTRPSYWRRQAREPVQFLSAVQTLQRMGVRSFIEVGPHPVLSGLGALAVPSLSGVEWLPTLRRGRGDGAVVLESLAALHCAGMDIDWEAALASSPGVRIDLPTYPFQRRRYWLCSEPQPACRPPRPPPPQLPLQRGLSGWTPAELEREVRERLAQVLRTTPDEVRMELPFARLGVDSLMAVKVRNALSAALGLALPANLLLTHDSASKLADHLAGLLAGSHRLQEASPARSGAGLQPPVPSSGQRRFWYLEQRDPGSGLYNVLFLTRMRGALDLGALQRSLAEISRRHEILRTTYREGAEGLELRLEPPGQTEPEVTDLRGHPVDRRERELRRAAAAFGALPFDLTTQPPQRFALFILGDADHTLAVSQHHIATDGWSVAVFRRELALLYRAFSAGLPAPLPPLALQFSEVASREQRAREAGEGERSLQRWLPTLQGLPLLSLPTDHQRPDVRSHRGGSVSFAWSAELSARVHQCAAREGWTVFHLLLTAYAVLLSRWSGQPEVSVGVITANREAADVEDLIGPFVNTVVLRCDASGEPSFAALGARIRGLTGELLVHPPPPLEELVRALGATRDGELNPLVRHCFVFQNTPVSEVDLGPHRSWEHLLLNPAGAVEGTAKFDLNLVMAEHGGRLEGMLEFSADLFEASSIARVARWFENIVAEAAREPHQHLGGLPMITLEERAFVDQCARGPGAPLSPGAGLPGLLRERARCSPEATAVVYEGSRLSYAELLSRSARLARHLRGLGVVEGDRVGVFVNRSPELVVSMLAVLESGAVLVMLDPTFPLPWLERWVTRTGVRRVITRERLLPRLPAGIVAPVLVDAHAASILERPSTPPRLDGPASAAAVLLPELEAPRPSALTSSGLASLLVGAREELGMVPSDRALAVTPVSSAAALVELMLPLVAGARVEIASRALACDGEALASRLAEAGITWMHADPSTWWSLMDAGWSGARSFQAVVAATALAPELAEPLGERAGGGVSAVAGIPGATVWSTVRRYGPGAASSVARPLAGTLQRVVDTRREPAPLNVPGEVVVGGAAVAVPLDPSAPEERSAAVSPARGRLRPDGVIEIVPPSPAWVQVRGVCVDLREVEHALLEHPAIARAEVRLEERRSGDGFLLAELGARTGEIPPAAELRTYLQARLPDPMVPSALVVERGEAGGAAPALSTRAWPAGEQVFSTPAARDVARIWREALGHADFGPTDDFFTVGGHSLLLVRVANALGRTFHRRVRISELFRHTTVAALAAHLESTAASPEPVRGCALVEQDAPLHVLFERRVERGPGTTALIEPSGRACSCEELNLAAEGYAARLRALGVGPGACVGLSMVRSIDAVSALLGILRSGAAYVPLPLDHPPARRETIARIARVSAVVDAQGVHAVSGRPLRFEAGLSPVDHPCAVLASSGSTGRPKLIVRSHRSFLHRLQWTRRVHPYAAGEVCCQKSHPTTTHALYELFEPLLGDAPCVLFPDGLASEADAFWELVTRFRVSRLLLIPSFVRASLESPGFTLPDQLRVLVLMGEAVEPALAERIVGASPPQAHLCSIYGSTEASSSLLCDLRLDLRDGRLPLGRPLDPTVVAEVLDEQGSPVTPGAEGRLYVGGRCLFSGYLDGLEADPRWPCAGPGGSSRRFDTADRVRLGEDGSVEFLGRMDHVVKVRGARVDLAEVERALGEFPGVATYAVVVGRDASGGVVLNAFVSPDSVDPAALLEHLRRHLPGPMLPSRFLLRPQLPRTSSGKIDRQALARMIQA